MRPFNLDTAYPARVVKFWRHVRPNDHAVAITGMHNAVPTMFLISFGHSFIAFNLLLCFSAAAERNVAWLYILSGDRSEEGARPHDALT